MISRSRKTLRVPFTSWKLSSAWSCPNGTFVIVPVQSRRPLLNGTNFLNNYNLTAGPLNVTLSFLVFFFSSTVHFVFPSASLALFLEDLYMKISNNHDSELMLCYLVISFAKEIGSLLF